MRIVFMGNPEFALPALKALQQSKHKIAAVVTSPDRPQGRGRKLRPLPVKAYAMDAGLPILSPSSLRKSEFLSEMRSLNPAAFVVVAFRILPRELFTIPRLGAINLHPSLLPRSRGPAPIQWTLLRGETEGGVSIIQLTEKIDGGGILLQDKVSIKPQHDFGYLHDRLADLGSRMLVQVLDALENRGTLTAIEQDDSLVTNAPKLKAENFRIDWSRPSSEIQNMIRAFSPAPGASTVLGGQAFKILKSEIVSAVSLAPGELRVDNETLFVGTGSEALRLIVVKPAGKKAMPSDAFLRGCRSLPEYFDAD
jgi:methionyl-tRNA formyltransferase